MTENEKMLSGDVLFENIEIVPLTESPSANPHRLLKIRGVGSRGGVVNSNNRMYPTDVLAKAVEEANSKVSKGKFVGELDHPEVGRGSLANIAMKFTRLWMEGDELKYEADVLPTAKGHQLETLIRAGVIPGMSTRGFGGLDEQEINGRSVFVVESDFELAGIDAVLEESNQFAGIASYESKGGTEMDLTLEKLKSDYPELVIAMTEEIEEQLTETIRADLEAEFEQKVAAALEAKKEGWMEEAQKEAMESDEVKGLKAIVDAVVEAVQPVLQIETKEETDEELEVRVYR